MDKLKDLTSGGGDGNQSGGQDSGMDKQIDQGEFSTFFSLSRSPSLCPSLLTFCCLLLLTCRPCSRLSPPAIYFHIHSNILTQAPQASTKSLAKKVYPKRRMVLSTRR